MGAYAHDGGGDDDDGTELKNDGACVTFDPVGGSVGGQSAGVGGRISTQAANS